MADKYIPALGYDWLTRVYDPLVRLTTREITFKRALIDQADIHAGQRVLDLACGTGTLAVLIKRKYPLTEVLGIDGDPKILTIAIRKAEQNRVEIDFEEGMSSELPYADQSLDRVLSSLFFHHLTRRNKLITLREAFRVLKPEGELHIADWGLPASFFMRIVSQGIRLLDGTETTDDNFSGLLPSLVTETGFHCAEVPTHFNSLFGTIRLIKAKKLGGLF